MFNVTTKSMEWGEETLTLETGKIARQADGTVHETRGPSHRPSVQRSGCSQVDGGRCALYEKGLCKPVFIESIVFLPAACLAL